jgi:MFS family permease
VSIAVVPILVTAGQAPEFSAPEQVSLRRLYSISPLAMVGMLFQGVSTAMTFGMGTAYAKSIGMTSSQASLFLVAVTIGTMLLQYPVGRLSDVLDRRLVIFLVAMISATAAAAATFFSAEQFWPLITLTAIYGGFSMTIYSLCIAHANDYLTPSQMVGTASTLIMVNGIGAIVGSPLIAVFMDLLSNRAYFIGLAIIHVATGIYALARMKARAPVPAEAQGPFIAVPEAGTAIAATLNPEAAWDDITEDDDLATGILSANPYLELPPQTDNN